MWVHLQERNHSFQKRFLNTKVRYQVFFFRLCDHNNLEPNYSDKKLVLGYLSTISHSFSWHKQLAYVFLAPRRWFSICLYRWYWYCWYCWYRGYCWYRWYWSHLSNFSLTGIINNTCFFVKPRSLCRLLEDCWCIRPLMEWVIKCKKLLPTSQFILAASVGYCYIVASVAIVELSLGFPDVLFLHEWIVKYIFKKPVYRFLRARVVNLGARVVNLGIRVVSLGARVVSLGARIVKQLVH